MRPQRSLGDLLPLAAVEPDGLIVTSDARYLRLLECARLLQPLRGGRAHRDQLATLAARLPAHQGIQVVVEAEPLDVDRDPQRALPAIGLGDHRPANPARPIRPRQ